MSTRFVLIISLLTSIKAFGFIPEFPHPSIETKAQQLTSSFEMPEYLDITVPLDPDFSKQWWLKNVGQIDNDEQVGKPGADIKMLEALEIYDPKEEVVLAVIDSGLDMNHEDVDYENLWVNQKEKDGMAGVDDDNNGYIDDLHGWNMVHQTPSIQDNKYHGTHVSGMISAISNNDKGIFGRVPGVRIMLIKIWDKGGGLFKSYVGEAIRYACDNGAKVLSNSYGTPSANKETKDAIKYCLSKGALFVSAAGNVSQNLDINPDYPSSFGYKNQIVVGASDNQDGRATFSNYGQTVDILAPGKDIYSLSPKSSYRYLSGTSQACPLVALTAAMTLAHNPELNLMELKERVINSSDEFKRMMRWSKYGGRLNVLNSLLGATGKRIQKHDTSTWKEDNVTIESPHPYPRRKTTELEYKIDGAKRFRFYFNRFEVHNYDTVIVKDKNGTIIERYNGELLPFWSQVIEGDSATITLKAGSSPLKFGYLINKIQYQK